ncbi:hypothetical protein F4604DRAFT_1674903 [Suillus subluteus]|nr:hypothetical protein F4604DRAFT_1674903 [Suillus subluteus]
MPLLFDTQSAAITIYNHSIDSVCVNPGFTRCILGVPKPESDTILNFLFHQITENINFQVCFHWEPNSIVFWDNRALLALVCEDADERGRSGNIDGRNREWGGTK